MTNQVATLKMGQNFKKTPVGEIPVDWTVGRLGELTEIQIGGTPSRGKPEYWDSQLQTKNHWVTIADMKGRFLVSTKERLTDLGIANSNAKRIPKGTVLMSFKLTIGRVAIAGFDLYTNEAIAAFSPRADLDATYLAYALPDAARSQEADVAVKGNTLNKAKLREILIAMPPIEEQKKIAEILSAVDDSIRANLVVAERLRYLKKGLARILLRGQRIKRNPQDTVLGKIPSHWNIASLDQVCEKIQDGTHFSPKSKSGPYMYVTSKNIRMGRIDLSNASRISEEEHREIYKRADVRFGDVLLTKDGASVGNIAVNTIREEFSLLSSVAFLRPNPSRVISGWICQFFADEFGGRLLKNQVSGQAITRLTLDKIKKLPIILPPLDEQRQIVAVLDMLDESVATEIVCVERLNRYKTALARILLTGKMRIGYRGDKKK